MSSGSLGPSCRFCHDMLADHFIDPSAVVAPILLFNLQAIPAAAGLGVMFNSCRELCTYSMALDLAACKQELADVKAAAATAAVQARQQIAALELQLAQQKAVPASRSTSSPMRARVAEVVDMLHATCGE